MAGSSTKPLLAGPVSGPVCVASIGECMVEMAPAGEAGHFRQSFAGDTLNTLWYLRQVRPTWTARFVSRVGQDPISDDMVAMMSRAGIDTGHLQRDNERTVGLYLISLKDGERSFSYWRGQSAARRLADDPAQVVHALSDADVVFFSGITLAILDDAGRAALLEALSDAREAGKTIAFDPNLRPRLWANADRMRDGITQGASVADIVLPSFDEEADHFGDAALEATSERYLAAGAQAVIVKNGPGAAHYVLNGQSGKVTPAPVTEIVDTTSAGDSFNAGLLAGLAQFGSAEEAIGLASRVARQVIGRKGALVTLDMDAVNGSA